MASPSSNGKSKVDFLLHSSGPLPKDYFRELGDYLRRDGFRLKFFDGNCDSAIEKIEKYKPKAVYLNGIIHQACEIEYCNRGVFGVEKASWNSRKPSRKNYELIDSVWQNKLKFPEVVKDAANTLDVVDFLLERDALVFYSDMWKGRHSPIPHLSTLIGRRKRAFCIPYRDIMFSPEELYYFFTDNLEVFESG